MYRLEKIKKLTGLDLREFDDAITFKVALMVKKYLVSRGSSHGVQGHRPPGAGEDNRIQHKIDKGVLL